MAAMQLRHEITYDAPADAVWEMLADPAFRERSCDAMGVLDRDVTIERTGEGMRVRIDQVQPTAGVPSFAKKFAGETTRAVQSEVWSDRRRATLEVDTPGKPSQIRGTLTLVESGGRTTEVFEGEVKVRVPLIGGKLESLVAELFKAGMDNEHTAGVAWLGGER